MQKVFMKALCMLFMLALGTALGGCGFSKQQIQRELKIQFQEKMDSDPIYQNFNITVMRVILFKRSPGTYDGKIQIRSGGSRYNIGVEVETDGREILWQENILDFLPLLGAELLKNIDTSSLGLGL